MSFFTFLYNLILGPLVLLFDTVYAIMYRMTGNEGLSIIALSLAINLLILPLYRQADAMQEAERLRLEKLSPGVDHIKKVFKGDERFMMLQTYYRQNDYKPYYALSGSVSLLLEIPFFIAAYRFLSGLDILKGASFGPIADLGLQDGLIHIAGHHVNLLPVLMTAINIVSGYIYTRDMPLKSKIQLYGMALVFLVFLYTSPSGLVFYWTLNNVFSLVKNVFYRIKNPKLFLCAMSTCFAAVMLPYLLFWSPIDTIRMKLFTSAGLALMLTPLPLYYLIKRRGGISVKLSEATPTDNAIFYICCVCMAVMTGVLIPSAVISSSPEEFVSVVDFHSPVRYVLHAASLAAGTFLVWINLFYRLASPTAKKICSLVSVIVTGSAIINYMFFGKNYGNMSSLLQYDTIRYTAKADYLPNALALLLFAAAILALVRFVRSQAPVILRSVSLATCAALVIMSCMNIFTIQSSFGKLKGSMSEITNNQGVSFNLDKKGKNVVFVMLDRAIGDFFPYIMNEKPELQEKFAGFTYYPNTISYGNCSLLGFPGLYGGYEYIPEEMNKRDGLTIAKKQDEALKIMPSIFLQNGYEVTVCDPTLAGFHWVPNLSVFDEYPEIKKYITKGVVGRSTDQQTTEDLLNRNFFAYSIFRTSPSVLHLSVYNKGLYNHSGKTQGIQVIDNMYKASGGFDGTESLFANTYSALKSFPAMTRITDSGANTFLMISNDTAHDIVMLQEPGYEPSDNIDNTEFEENPPVRYAADGSKLVFKTVKQLTHYQCNMAAMIQLGNWLDYLRENGVYDNTRIIIAADHGRNLDYLFDKCIENGKGDTHTAIHDALIYDPLLLVKDFDSQELITDASFMTNADTPTLAFAGLVEDPVNPFTGNKITSDGKNAPVHHIAGTRTWNLDDYKGDEKQYKNLIWVELSGTDTTDRGAWRVIGKKLQ